MLIIYCEQCKKLVSAADVTSGRAVMRAENEWLCLDCAPRKVEKAEGRRVSGGTVMLPPRRISSAKSSGDHSAVQKPSSSRDHKAPLRAQPADQKWIVIGLCAAGVCLAVIALILSTRKPPEGALAKGETVNSTRTPGPPSSGGGTTIAPVAPTPPTKSSEALSFAERQKLAEKEIEEMRNKRAANVLEEHKSWFALNKSSSAIYTMKLRQFMQSNRSTPAAAEAERLIGELKLPPGLSGRFVRIEIPGTGKVLTLAEVEVLGAGKNFSRGAKATQSSNYNDCKAERAVDGRTNGGFGENSLTHTEAQDNPWWEADLGGEKEIDTLVIWNRTDDCCRERLKDFRVALLDAARKPVWETTVSEIPNPNVILNPVAK